MLISTIRNKDRIGNKGGEELYLTKRFRNKRENRKQVRGRTLFDKTFYNENNEKNFYQTIAKQLLSNFEL